VEEKEREQVALFRYGLIAPILQGAVQVRATYIAQVAARMHEVPGQGLTQYSPKTIEYWFREVPQGGVRRPQAPQALGQG
jgi:hypothetical protein